MGCWNNAHLRSLESEVPFTELLEDYKIRTHPIRKCYEAARRARKFIFALTDGGSCTVSSSQHNTYRQNGSSTNCGSKGTGGPGTINVYVTNGKYCIVLYCIVLYSIVLDHLLLLTVVDLLS